jgi:hypothetical protein
MCLSVSPSLHLFVSKPIRLSVSASLCVSSSLLLHLSFSVFLRVKYLENSPTYKLNFLSRIGPRNIQTPHASTTTATLPWLWSWDASPLTLHGPPDHGLVWQHVASDALTGCQSILPSWIRSIQGSIQVTKINYKIIFM